MARPERLELPAGESLVLPRGLGRAYGDAAVPSREATLVLETGRADRILDWDPVSGRLTAEAGLSLAEVLRLFVPRGWFPPVTPGTKFVTLGGCVATDVHGKNHHRDGSFGHFVDRLTVLTSDGKEVACGPDLERELFLATVGGMGLTGLITEVTLRLRPVESGWIVMESEGVPDLDHMVSALESSGRDWPYTVGWIDCLASGAGLGRGVLLRGRHAARAEVPGGDPPARRTLRVPLDAPEWLLSPPAMRAFNGLTTGSRRAGAAAARGARPHLVSYESFFYPLDAHRRLESSLRPARLSPVPVRGAPRGGRAAMRELLERLAAAGTASFLAVIKDCGPPVRCLPVVPARRHHARAGPALSRPGHGRPRARAECHRDRRGRPRLSRQGRRHARRGLRPHGAPARRVAPLRDAGTRSGGSAPPCRCACSGTAREGRSGRGPPAAWGAPWPGSSPSGGTPWYLLGRDAGELATSARDLTARGARGPVTTGPLDLGDTAGFVAALDAADEAVGGVDALVVTAGDFAAQEELERDYARLRHLLDVNFTATAVLCQQMAERLAARGGGTICAFSSVAGDRPRRSNFLYGASKAGLSAFLDGLGLAYGARGVRVVCVRPGFVKTGMTAGLPVPPFAGEPDAVARIVLRALDRGTPVVYAPPIWRLVMLAIRVLPRAIMRRVRF